MQLRTNLKWRYATKSFDSLKKVSQGDLKKIKQVIQLSASSFGLQPYQILIIENEKVRKNLQLISWNQPQITEASHLVVFCNSTKVTEDDIDLFLEQSAKARNVSIESTKEYGNFIKEKIYEKSKEELSNWTARQTYLALGNLLAACAELKIDACPMEGFEADQYNDSLKLREQNLNAAVVAAIGYRSEKDTTQNFKKVRKPFSKLFKTI